jgi:hypothetical protein
MITFNTSFWDCYQDELEIRATALDQLDEGQKVIGVQLPFVHLHRNRCCDLKYFEIGRKNGDCDSNYDGNGLLPKRPVRNKFGLLGYQSSPVSSRVARFFLVQHTKTGKNVPNYHKIYQMSIKYTKWLYVKIDQHIPLQDSPKTTQIWIFGLKVYDLATLVSSCSAPRTAPTTKSWAAGASSEKALEHLNAKPIEI